MKISEKQNQKVSVDGPFLENGVSKYESVSVNHF